MNGLVPLTLATDSGQFGGKAARLGQLISLGLPTPSGFALSSELCDKITDDKENYHATIAATIFKKLNGPLAVRSSAIGEDSENHSFAGLHETILNVNTPEQLKAAINHVVDSRFSASAGLYRDKRHITAAPKIGVVIQELVLSDVAGVLFSNNPVTGAHEFCIEGAYGFGELVVDGTLIPDQFRLTRKGELLEQIIGLKDLRSQCASSGGTENVEVDDATAATPCLAPKHLQDLVQLACGCMKHFGDAVDIEWALHKDKLFVLQCRPITVAGSER
jgi:pyruvate,water dikinase